MLNVIEVRHVIIQATKI